VKPRKVFGDFFDGTTKCERRLKDRALEAHFPAVLICLDDGYVHSEVGFAGKWYNAVQELRRIETVRKPVCRLLYSQRPYFQRL